jgi:hypothetical protein
MTERFASWSRGCLTMQGYGSLRDGERRSLWLGLRFAPVLSPVLCLTGIALGTALASPALLLAMAVTAGVGGFFTAKHPFDYVYDAILQPLLGGPSSRLAKRRADSTPRAGATRAASRTSLTRSRWRSVGRGFETRRPLPVLKRHTQNTNLPT